MKSRAGRLGFRFFTMVFKWEN